jgi:hypothetical protein
MSPLLQYFGVKDVRQIRDSKRFKQELAPIFIGDMVLSMRGNDLEIVGWHLKDCQERGKLPVRGVYTFATEGAYAGRIVRAAMTF